MLCLTFHDQSPRNSKDSRKFKAVCLCKKLQRYTIRKGYFLGGVKIWKDLCKTDLLPSLIQTSAELCTLLVFEVKIWKKQLRNKNIYHNKLFDPLPPTKFFLLLTCNSLGKPDIYNIHHIITIRRANLKHKMMK